MSLQDPAAAQAAAYIAARYHVQPSYPFVRLPDHAVFRHAENGKWFAAFLPAVSRSKLGLTGDAVVDLLNVKCDPLLAGSLRDNARILPGYHMNKEHWLSIVLDGTVPADTLHRLIDLSYALTE